MPPGTPRVYQRKPRRMDLGSLPLWAQQLGGLILTVATAIGLTWSERRKRKVEVATATDHPGAQVVAATFTERGQMERLISALVAADMGVRENTEHVQRLTGLLERDFHRREVDAEVRQELRNRGIAP